MSKLVIREAKISDVYEILQNLSDINRQELNAIFGTSDPWRALPLAKEFMAAGPADVLEEDGKPVCLLGHLPHSLYTMHRVTWFLATQSFFANLAARTVAMGRRYLRGIQQNYPSANFYSYSKSTHPDAARWFKALGFTVQWDNGSKVFTLPASHRRDRSAAS